jgi:hypothetical protein
VCHGWEAGEAAAPWPPSPLLPPTAAAPPSHGRQEVPHRSLEESAQPPSPAAVRGKPATAAAGGGMGLGFRRVRCGTGEEG